jgi:hypothetical protein
VRWIDTGFALSFRSPKVQGIIGAAFLAIDTIGMDWAIGMNRAAVAHRAEPLFLLVFLANSLVSRKYFVPVLIGLHHRIHLALVLRAIWVAGFVAKTLGAVPGSEIEPTTGHVFSLRQQLSANRVLCGDLAPRIADGNVLSDGLTVIRVVAGVGCDDLSVSREGRIDFPN